MIFDAEVVFEKILAAAVVARWQLIKAAGDVDSDVDSDLVAAHNSPASPSNIDSGVATVSKTSK